MRDVLLDFDREQQWGSAYDESADLGEEHVGQQERARAESS
jgi:hypothetical protein